VKLSLLILIPTSLLALPSAVFAQSADTVYVHGSILTGVGLDTAAPQRVEALAIANGEVIAAGASTDILAKYKGAQVIDLGGAFAMPGFNDAHVHLGEAGRIKLSVDLTGTRSLAEMQARVRSAAMAAPAGTWLLGGGWDHTLWATKVLPTRADLDAVTGAHPAIFSRIDGHIAIANSAALAAAGITGATLSPSGGKIDHDAQGEPTGILREDSAMELVWAHVPPPTTVQRRRGLELALADAAAHGLTSAQDNSDWEDFLVLEQMEREGHLPIRVTEWLAFSDPIETLEAHQAAHNKDDRMLHTGMLKGFMDGSLGSRTAAMLAPYADDPDNSGIPRYQQAGLDRMAAERAAAGFQMGFHAIGDRAVTMALDAFAVAESATTQANGTGRPAHLRDPRYRIEHSQVLAPGDFARYKQLGVIASMQPNHLLTDMAWAPARLGPEREKYAYAWKSFLDAGVPLAFGTDYPVEPITPFRGVYCAVTRMNEAGTQTFHPEQKLTLSQALDAYTQGSAYAEFAEPWKGKLAPGYAADFVVLDRDPFAVTPTAILATNVVKTVVAGKIVYAQPSNLPPH
jgi:predicted amidohydrolase YtcJ